MKISFVTPTRMSIINLTTIGDSEKRGDDTKIGQFSSGQAYATALLLRDGVDMSITIYGGEELNNIQVSEHHSEDEKYTEYITYSPFIEECKSTGKSKELIGLQYEKVFHGRCNSIGDFKEPSETEEQFIQTGFALQLGYNWETWMSLRELWSNMLDECGYWVEGSPEVGIGTVITLDFSETTEFAEVWNNRHLYINEKEPLYIISNNVEVLENDENYLRIYKQNILVYEDKNKPSRFAYNIKFGNIDERRILSDLYSVEGNIVDAVKNTKNEEFLREIISNEFYLEDGEFLSDRGSYGTASDLIHDIAFEVYEQYGEVKSYNWLLDCIKERKDCKIGGKKIKSVGDSIWSYSTTVTVETNPETFSTPEIIETEEEIFEDFFVAEIKKYYNFNLDVEVKKAKLKGSKVIADKFHKCLIVDDSFDIDTDFPEFIVQYLDLTMEGNVVKNLSKYVCELLKK